MDQRRKNDHRNTDDPDHLQKAEEAVVKAKGNTEPYDRYLEKDQPQPSRHKKARQLSFAFAARKLQVRTGAGKEYEYGRAEMLSSE